MTTYILNSGGMRDKPELSRKFFDILLKGCGTNPKVLLCFFANPREEWEYKYRHDVESIPSFVPEGVIPSFEMAMPDTFTEQIARSDAVYIHGGDDHLVQYWLKHFDLPRIFAGTTVGASSAGSNALATHFWTYDWRTCMDGLGVLPIKFIAHYGSDFDEDDPRGSVDWERAYTTLSEYGDPSLPVYALEEGHFEVFER